MKKFFSKLPLLCVLAVLCGMISSCDLTGGKFSVSIKEVGSSYVDLEFTGPAGVEVLYLLDTKEQKMSTAILSKKGNEMIVNGGDVVRITDGIDENTQYYIYLVEKKHDVTNDDIFTLPFKTSSFDFGDELVTVLDNDYDGYRVRLTLKESTKKAGNAIRWSQSDIMMYNYMKSNDDYFSLLHNGGSIENAALKDTTVVYSEMTNWYQTDQDSDGDGELDWENRFNPISPGEPVVFIAGEFSYMEDKPEYETEYFKFPSGWSPGYYKPLIDESYYSGGNKQSSVGVINDLEIKRPLDDYWTGDFRRKLFLTKEPSLLDGKVDVKCVQATPINLTLEFYPDENVEQYAVGIYDDSMYAQILDLLNGREEYRQWAMTSYFAAYTLGTRVASGAVSMDLNTFYYEDAIAEGADYHVLVTAIGDNAATTQSFQKYTFSTTARVKDEPVIEVKAVKDATSPYKATFNVKCTTAAEGNPVTQCYYGANYLRDWLLTINSGSTYHSIVAGNKQYSYFTEDEIELINSEEGLDISIPSIDGETTRLVVLGYNDEYTPNDLLSFKNIEECPAVADCTTPYCDPKPWVNPDEYVDLVSDWTATAILSNSDGTKQFEHKSKITLAADLYDYPETLTQDVYDLYAKSDFDKDEVDAMWREFKALAKEITEERLENQNRLIGIGWLDKDSYNRLTARTPYDLFVATDYSSVDVSSLYNDFGPKWYLETSEDENGNIVYSIPIDANFLPPTSNWSVPFYLGAMEKENYLTITYGDGWTPSFPVTVSADRNTITIHPFEYQGVKYYPNIVGVDKSMQQTILENPIISEITLTRGWSGSDNKQSSVAVSSGSVDVKGDFPKTAYKSRSRMVEPVKLEKISGTVVTPEQFKANADKLVERIYMQNN